MLWLGMSLVLIGILASLVSLWYQAQHAPKESAPTQRPVDRHQLETTILANLEQGILVIDHDGQIIHATGAVETLLGYAPQELVGQHAGILSPDQSPHSSLKTIREALAGKPLPREWITRHRDGSLIPVDAAMSSLVDVGGGRQVVAAVIRGLTAQKAMEARLKDQTRRFFFFLEAIPHFTWISNQEGRLIFINQHISQYLGIQIDDPLEAAWRKVGRPEDQGWVMAKLAKVAEERSSYEFEVELRSQVDGAYRWYRINGAPLLDEGKEAVHWYGIATDIDDLVRVRQELQARERVLRSLVNSQKTYLMRTDEQGYFIFANTAFQQAFYPSEEDLVGQYSISTNTLHPDDIPLCIKVAHRCLAQPGVYHTVVLRKPKKDLGYFFTEWEFVGIADEQEQGVAVQAMGRDITQQKAVESERANLGLVVENTDHGIVITDPDGYTLWLNEAFTEISGYSLQDMKGERPASLLAGPETPPDSTAQIHQTISQGKEVHLETINHHKSGRPYWVELTLKPIRDEQGQVIQYFSIERDITAQKERTQALERLTQDLTHRNQELSEFAYVISHNLRAPVANILGLTEILGTFDTDDDNRREVIDHLQLATQRLDGVILDLQGLLDMRQGSGEEYQMCDLMELVDWVQIQLHHQFERIEVQLDLDFTAQQQVTGILPYLQSILQNLLSNSLKYRHPDRLLHLSVVSRVEDRSCLISVADNGLGINLDHHSKDLFQLYQRFHTHTDGKGLGLYLVKTQVEAMGGTISAESIPDQGTTFHVRLPLRELA
jgi:PAS domain S-box-containing protein